MALRKGSGQIINLGSEKGSSVLELCELLQRLTGFAGAPQFAPARLGEIQQIYLSGRKAREILGWQPTVNLAEGMRQTVDWMKQVKDTGRWR